MRPRATRIGQYVAVGLWGLNREPAGQGDDGAPGAHDFPAVWFDEELTFKQWKARAVTEEQHEIQEAAFLWRAFASMPGEHLVCPALRIGRSHAVTTSDNEVLGTFRRHLLGNAVEMESAAFGNQRCALYRGRRPPSLTLVDTATGESIIRTAGRHVNPSASSSIILSDGRLLSFPLRGSRAPIRGSPARRQVMRASDSAAGKTVMYFRVATVGVVRHTRVVYEAVIPPDEQITRDLLWVVYSAPVIWRNFSIPTGGVQSRGGGG